MLAEWANVRQIAGEPERRWFSDEDHDLIVWEAEGRVVGFQLCYDKKGSERALTWTEEHGYSHDAVDNGETQPGTPKRTPILMLDGYFNADRVAEEFRDAAAKLPSDIVAFVESRVFCFPQSLNRGKTPPKSD